MMIPYAFGGTMKSVAFWLVVGMPWLLMGCGNGGSTYSLLADSQSFQQNSAQQNTQIDILWVIDNSGSMASSQTNLANNFPSFINKIVDKNYDFQLAVTTSDAFLSLPIFTNFYNQSPKPIYYGGGTQEAIAGFRDGVGNNHTGLTILNPTSPNLVSNFIVNATQGTSGYGDERSLQSLKAALESPLNAGFVRPGAFLAVIILTDEDDFSHDGTAALSSYTGQLHALDSYVTFLDGVTNSTASSRRYSVNTISVNDQTCLNSIFNGAQKIGVRVGELAEATGGIKGDLCGDFAEELDLISQSIVELSTQFYFGSKIPVPSTIRVSVNGQTVPEASANPAQNGGWTYKPENNTLVFTGDYVPPQGASIAVTFDPESITF